MNEIFNNDFNYVTFNNELFSVSKTTKPLTIQEKDKKINIVAEYLVLNRLSSNDWSDIEKKIINELKWEKLSNLWSKIPNSLLNSIKKISLHILSNQYLFYGKYSYQLISNFLSNFKFDSKELSTILFNIEMINKSLNIFTKNVIEYDSKNGKKFLKDFLNVQMINFSNSSIEKQLVELYEFDYDSQSRYFKNSINENNINDLKQYINSVKSNESFLKQMKLNINVFEEIKTKFFQMYEKIKFGQSFSMISFKKEIEDTELLFKEKFDEKEKILIGNAAKIEQEINQMCHRYLKNFNDLKNIPDKLTSMRSLKLITIEEKDKLASLNKYRNKWVHKNMKSGQIDVSEQINIYNINENLEEAQRKLEETKELILEINKRNKR